MLDSYYNHTGNRYHDIYKNTPKGGSHGEGYMQSPTGTTFKQTGKNLTEDQIAQTILEGNPFGIWYGPENVADQNKQGKSGDAHYEVGVGFAQAEGHPMLVVINDSVTGTQKVYTYEQAQKRDGTGGYDTNRDGKPDQVWSDTFLRVS